MMDPVANAREKRGSASVSFARFLEIRAAMPEVPIAAVEGRDDLGVWKVWFVRSGLEDHIELLPCSGKEKVFELREILRRNKRQKVDNVIYLVDRDYDDWAGHEPSSDVFITDRYSIENYFVCERVLDHILNNQFLSAGKPAEKKPIIDGFRLAFNNYRTASDEIQKRTYCARRLGIEKGRALPSKFRQIVNVIDILTFNPLPESDIKIDGLEGRDQSEMDALREEFSSLHFLERARGKYHRAFLQFFLQSLQEEQDPAARSLFPHDKPATSFKFSSMNLTEWAGVSQMPEGLLAFLHRNFDRQAAA